MRKIKFLPLFLLLPLLNSKVSFFDGKGIKADVTYNSLETIIKNKPGTVTGDYLYDELACLHMNEGDISYCDIADYSTDSVTYGYGYEEEGIGSALYLEAPGGYFNPILKGRTEFKKDISTGDGFMMYVDSRGMKAQEGHYYGIGAGFILMDSASEPASSTSLWEPGVHGGHFNYYFLVEGRAGYYYDYHEGRFLPSTIIGRTLSLKEGFRGWIYLPYESFGWNGNSSADYAMRKDAFQDGGYNWVIYTHFLTENIDADDTQSKIYFDELTFVKKKTTFSNSFSKVADLSPSCLDEGGEIYQDPTSKNLKLNNIEPALGHDYSYKKYKDGAVGECSRCGHLIYSDDPSIVSSASTGDVSNYVSYHFHYGENGEKEAIRIVKKGEKLEDRFEEPKIESETFSDGWVYDFSCWSSDQNYYRPKNPLDIVSNEDVHLYAKYLISGYDQIKYSHVTNLMAASKGRYNSPKGKIVMNGNSNFSLAHNVEYDWGMRGLPLINNACAGGSSYDYYYYCDQLVIGFAPKILCFNLTTNDQAYWSMSEKDIADVTDRYIKKVHQDLPDCYVAIVNASPLPGRSEMFATVERVNKWAAKYASSLDYVYYIDTYDFVYQRMMEYPEGWEFWTHMDTNTLSTWMNLIADGIQEIVDERGIIFNA